MAKTVREHMCTRTIYTTTNLYKKKIRDLAENHLNLFPEDIVGQQIVHQNPPVFHSTVDIK